MNTDNKTVSDKTADWLLFSTIKPSDNEEIMYWMGGVKTGHYNADKNIVLELGKLPKYWLPIEHSKFTPKEQTKGVIEGMEDAAKKYLQQIDHETGGMWTEDDNEIAQHFVLFANTHYMPLLEELNKMKQSFYMDICRAYNAGKQNFSDCVKAGNQEPFIASHDYFISEFPKFNTNVP